MRRGRDWLTITLAVVMVMGLGACQYGAELYDRQMNQIRPDLEAPVPKPEDTAFHQSLLVADLHADTLKWERDLLERADFGHVDVPRLMEGNVGLQVFAIVTSSPIRWPWRDCVRRGGIDNAAVLAALQGRPAFSTRARALHQVERFKDAAARSKTGAGPELRLIESAEDVHRLVADRQAGKDVIGGILAVEGAHWIGGGDADAGEVREDVRELFDSGVRVFAPTHRFDNDLAGSSEGCARYGLTEQGRVALAEAERLGMAVDLAHMSPAGIRDAAAMLERPFMVSHTGIQAGCEAPCRPARNLSDDEIAHVIGSGGIIGVGFWPQAIGRSIWRVADVMEHIMDIAEDLEREPSRYVALGSDYDGSVTPLIDVSRLDVLTAVMRQRSDPFDDDAIRDIAGRNACRLFAMVLPGGDRVTAQELCGGAQLETRPRPEDDPIAGLDSSGRTGG